MATTAVTAVHLLLYDSGTLLMSRRCNTGYEDGNYSVVAGHIEADEPVLAARARREAREEVGIDVDADDLEFVHVIYRRSPGELRTDFFFRCWRWRGTIENAEPHKCDDLLRAPNGTVLDNTVPYVRAALERIAGGRMFSEFEWSA